MIIFTIPWSPECMFQDGYEAAANYFSRFQIHLFLSHWIVFPPKSCECLAKISIQVFIYSKYAWNFSFPWSFLSIFNEYLDCYSKMFSLNASHSYLVSVSVVLTHVAFCFSECLDSAIEHYGISKVSLLRAVCNKCGIQILLREYQLDSKSRQTFNDDDIINVFPIIKHIQPKVWNSVQFC